MSSGEPGTRARLVAAAAQLLEEVPAQAPTMQEVAVRAGVSRQAVYLHFADRTALFVEVARAADAGLRTPARQRMVDEAPTGRQALREAIALQAWLKPRLRGIATAMDVLRRSDPAAEAAWQEREQARLGRCVDLVQRLRAEGCLADGWDVASAARCFWAVTSQRVWDDLVRDQGWSTPRYRRHLTRLLESALLKPESAPRGAATRGPGE